MIIQQQTDTRTPTLRESIAEEAADWLVTFRSVEFSDDDPYRDAAVRDAAFFEWIGRSAAHLLLFMEMVEVERRFYRLDAAALAEIRAAVEESQEKNKIPWQARQPYPVRGRGWKEWLERLRDKVLSKFMR